MKLIFCFVFLTLFVQQDIVAQTLRGAGFVDFSNSIDLANYGIQTYTFDNKIKESALLYSSSKIGYLVFKNNVKSNVTKLNYNQYSKQVIFETENKTYAFPIKFIDSIILLNEIDHSIIDQYLMTISIENDETVLLESVIDKGPARLMKYCKYGLKKPSYNSALDVGTKEYTYTKKDIYYVSKDERVFLLPRKKRQLINDKGVDDELKAFYKKKTYKLKNEDNIIQFIQAFNSSL